MEKGRMGGGSGREKKRVRNKGISTFQCPFLISFSGLLVAGHPTALTP